MTAGPDDTSARPLFEPNKRVVMRCLFENLLVKAKSLAILRAQARNHVRDILEEPSEDGDVTDAEGGS